MEIRIYLINGKAHTFTTDDEAAEEQIIEAVSPARFFSQPMVQLQGPLTMVTLNPAAIEFMDFRTDIEPPWAHGRSFTPVEAGEPEGPIFDPVRLITPDQYLQLRAELAAAATREEGGAQEAIREVEAVVELMAVSGAVRHLRFHATFGPSDKKRRVALHLFEPPAIRALWAGGGFTLINPENMTSFRMTPAPPERAQLVWHAEEED